MHEVLKGDATEGVVIAEFPSIEAAKAWYDSPAYKAVREHRFKGAIYRDSFVQGVFEREEQRGHCSSSFIILH